MNVYPTSTATHLTVVGVGVFGVGVILQEAFVVAWGGAFIFALALARAFTLVSVLRIRAAGFEMLWSGRERTARVECGGTVVLDAEVRNRDTLAARYDRLRVVASPLLEASVEPTAGEVRAGSAVKVRVRIRALRVGYHGIYGLALEVRGAPGLFEVPLTFANPFGVEVQPRALARVLAQPHGGRSGSLAAVGRSGRSRGDGTELRELREHLPGDPFRRIAWKATARRGVLVVREFEREERDVVVLVLDASVELWSGLRGEAPLDVAIDMAANLASRHLTSGDHVGLCIVGGRQLAYVPPGSGREQATRISSTLVERTGVLDADRCGWDEADLVMQVAEHLRPLDPRSANDMRRGKVDKLLKRAAAMRAHAPFALPAPYGRSPRDTRLRRYAACFGIHAPARLQPDRPRSLVALAKALTDAAKNTKPRVSLVHVVAPPPLEGRHEELDAAVRRLKARRVAVRWTPPPLIAGFSPSDAGSVSVRSIGHAMEHAVMTRALVAQMRGETTLRRIGVRLVRLNRRKPITGQSSSATVDDGRTGKAPPPMTSTEKDAGPPIAPEA